MPRTRTLIPFLVICLGFAGPLLNFFLYSLNPTLFELLQPITLWVIGLPTAMFYLFTLSLTPVLLQEFEKKYPGIKIPRILFLLLMLPSLGLRFAYGDRAAATLFVATPIAWGGLAHHLLARQAMVVLAQRT